MPHPAGATITREPVQILLAESAPAPIAERDDFSIRPLARYVVEGRVLRTKRYRFDPVSDLAPYDVGLGWGKMSDTAVLAQLKLTQSTRFLFWRWQNQPPLPPGEITAHASNNHLIAADSAVARRIAWLREGELIRIEGSLVEATGPGNQKWTSSLRRDDSGKGACEIIWVTQLTKLSEEAE